MRSVPALQARPTPSPPRWRWHPSSPAPPRGHHMHRCSGSGGKAGTAQTVPAAPGATPPPHSARWSRAAPRAAGAPHSRHFRLAPAPPSPPPCSVRAWGRAVLCLGGHGAAVPQRCSGWLLRRACPHGHVREGRYSFLSCTTRRPVLVAGVAQPAVPAPHGPRCRLCAGPAETTAAAALPGWSDALLLSRSTHLPGTFLLLRPPCTSSRLYPGPSRLWRPAPHAVTHLGGLGASRPLLVTLFIEGVPFSPELQPLCSPPAQTPAALRSPHRSR